MSTEGVDAFVTVVYELRWVLVVLGFIASGGIVAGANHRAKQAEKATDAALDLALSWQEWADGLEAVNAHLRDLIQPETIALPTRKGTETSHG